MLYVCVQKFDVMGTVWKILGTKQGLGITSSPIDLAAEIEL